MSLPLEGQLTLAATKRLVLSALATHLPILEALFMRFCLEANATRLPDNKSKLLRMALASQTSYARTVALIAGLKLQREGRAHVSIDVTEGIS